LFFDKLFAIANASKSADSVALLEGLKGLKRQMLSAEAEEREATRKAAKDFTLREAVLNFGLTYSPSLRDAAKHVWNIETLPDVKISQSSPPYLGKVSP
jgi:hypothetical protein